MAKLSWKKALIEKAHTFMDYVVGWRGFYTTENVATKQASNTWVVPQKLTEVPQQTQTGYFDSWYNLPYMVGFSSSDLRYRYPANNQGYQFLKNYNEGQQQSNQVIKVDYRNNVAMKWGETNAGVGVTGTFRNYAHMTQNLLQNDGNGDTYWRILYSSNTSSYDIKPYCDDGSSNVWQEVLTNVNTLRTPFVQGLQGSWGNDFKNNTVVQNYYLQRIGRVFDKYSDSRDRTQVISFYVWTGFLNEEWIRKSQPTVETITPCGGTQTKTLRNDVSRLTIPNLVLWFQNTNEKSLTTWYANDIDYNRTCLTLNLLNRSHTVAYESNDGDTISNAEFIDNVQFETCPYDYVRIKIFLRPNPKNETTTSTGFSFGRYTKMEIYSGELQANAKDILDYSIQYNLNYPSRYYNQNTIFTIYGLMHELSNYQFGKYGDYTTGDYIENKTFGSVGVGFTQFRLPNNYTVQNGDSYKDLTKRCNTFYFKINVDSTNATPSQNLGGWQTGGTNFAFFRSQKNTITTLASNTFSFTSMGIWRDHSNDIQQNRYYLKLDSSYYPSTIETGIEGKDYVLLNQGINAVAFNSENGNIVVNGKEYVADLYIANVMDYWQFNGKRTDYILEYGLWEENLNADILKQLTNVK
tara:strand:+ start:1307 stop:3211 length:1905 start_codon:yes stop_codon:yes gene_type:complete